MSLLQQDKDVRLQIAEYLETNGHKKTWLADKLNVSSAHIGEVLKCRRKLTDETLKNINEILKTDFKNLSSNETMKQSA